VLVERVEELTPERQWRKGYRDIVDFERTLADDGYVVIKFFLHISQKEQKRRFKKLEKDPLKSWHVQPEDWEHHRKYGDYVVAIEEMLERTDTEWGPWTIVEATDRRWARAKIFQTIIQRLEEALRDRGFDLPEVRERVKRKTELPEAVLEEKPQLPGDGDGAGPVLPDDVTDNEVLEAELQAEAEAQAEPAASSIAGEG
jgi:hypothetical protein